MGVGVVKKDGMGGVDTTYPLTLGSWNSQDIILICFVLAVRGHDMKLRYHGRANCRGRIC